MFTKRLENFIIILIWSLLEIGCTSDTQSLVNVHRKVNGGELSILYKNDIPIDSFFIKNNLIEGNRMTVDTIDSIKIYSSYINGKKNGTQKGYFLNNNIAYVVNFKNDTIEGEGKYYYPNGLLKVYEYKDKTGRIIYQRYYDNEGNSLKSVGRGLISFNRKSDTIGINEEYIAKITMATPPKTKSVIMISDYTRDSIGLNHKILEGVKPVSIYKETFNKKGVAKKIISWAIEDSLSGKIHKGQKFFNIYIK